MEEHICVCGKSFQSHSALSTHLSRSFDCQEDLGCTESSRASQASKAHADAEKEAGKRVRTEAFQVKMRRKLCLQLAKYRFIRRVAASHVDDFKSTLQNCLNEVLTSLAEEIQDPRILSIIAPKLQWLEGIETEAKELKFLRACVPVVKPIARPLCAPQESTDAEGARPLNPRVSKPRIAYDFKITELLARLIKHDARAREQIYETLISWRVKPEMKGKFAKIITDMTNGRVFLDHPVLGLQARVSEEEARRASPTAPLQMAILVWGDAFDPMNMMMGHYQSHGTLVIMYAIINLNPSIRASVPAIQLATVCRDSDAKAVGMVETLHGGETSLGAQLRKLAPGVPLRLRTPDGLGYENRVVSFHVPYATADFPQAAAFLPFKGSTSAHQYDR